MSALFPLRIPYIDSENPVCYLLVALKLKGVFVKKTPLNEEHRILGAKMVDFGGWDMPVQYTGVLEEHLAVREKVGLFDVSHMGEFTVKGSDALAFVQHVTCNDVSKLAQKQIHYSAFTYPEGTIVDDLLVYRQDDNEFFLVVNAANIEKDFDWITSQSGGFDVELKNVSDSYAQLAIQGPEAVKIAETLFGELALEMHYYWFDYVTYEGSPCILSRTGYTGEDGFEVYCPPSIAVSLWRRVLELGKPYGILPCGLGARDTLRLESKMCLYGNDIDNTTTVLEAGLGWICKLDKGDFIGADVLRQQKEEGLERRLMGFEMVDRGIARHGYPVYLEPGGEAVGAVTSGSFAPFLKKNIGLVYLPIEKAKIGTEIFIGIRKKTAKARVIKTPFYKRQK